MSVHGLQSLSSVLDPYLRQAAPLLQSYWNAVYEITKQKLMFQQKVHPHREPVVDQILQITVHISVPVMFPEVMEGQGSEMARAHRPSGKESNQVMSNQEVLYLIELLRLYNDKLHVIVELELMAVQGEKDEKLIELKESLDEFAKVLEKIADCYITKFLGCCDVTLPSLEIVKEKICKIKNGLKRDGLPSLFANYSEKFTTSYENIWCSILGLHDECGAYLLGLDDEMKMHQTWKYFIQKFVESKENLLKKDGYLEGSGRNGLIKNLQKIGFTHGSAGVIAESIPDDLIDTQLPSYWAFKHLDFAEMYHPLLANPPRYPYTPDVVDDWFKTQISLDERSEPRSSRKRYKKIKMINVDSKTNAGEKKVDEFLAKKEKKKKYVLLFHGTSHANAQSILKSGIILGKGKERQDFSDGYGFYVGEQFNKAKRWSRDRYAHRAVVVFKVNRDLVDPSKEKGLDVTNEKESGRQLFFFIATGVKIPGLRRSCWKTSHLSEAQSV